MEGVICICKYIYIHTSIHTVYIYIYICGTSYKWVILSGSYPLPHCLHFPMADLIFFFRFFLAAGLTTAPVSCQQINTVHRPSQGWNWITNKALNCVGWFINHMNTLLVSITNHKKCEWYSFFDGFLTTKTALLVGILHFRRWARAWQVWILERAGE